MQFFLQHKTVILRTVGTFFLLIGFIVRFWVMPQEGVSQSDIAAVNVARMEASVKGVASSKHKEKKESSHFLKKLKDTQKKQLEYLTIIVMILGAISLGYSFIKKREE